MHFVRASRVGSTRDENRCSDRSWGEGGHAYREGIPSGVGGRARAIKKMGMTDGETVGRNPLVLVWSFGIGPPRGIHEDMRIFETKKK